MRGHLGWRTTVGNIVRDTSYEEYGTAITAIAHMGIKERKQLLKCARCQRGPYRNTKLMSESTTIYADYSTFRDPCNSAYL